MRKKVGFLLNGPRFLCVALLLLAGLVFLQVNQAQAVITVVDHFTDTQLPGIVANSTTPHPLPQSQAGVMMGGIRWLDLIWLAGPNNDSTSVGPAVNTHDLYLNCGSETSGNLLVTWNGNASYANYSLAQNLNALGDRFIVNVVSTDFGVASGGQLRVYTDATHFSVATLFIPTLIVSPGIAITVKFSAFVGNVDWTNVNRIEMFLPGVPDLDLTIDDVVISCVAPKPTFSDFHATPNPLLTCTAQDVSMCFTNTDNNATVTVYDVTGGFPGTVVIAPVRATGSQQCFTVSVPTPTPRTYFADANDTCQDANDTLTIICTPPPPGKVPSLTEWGAMLLLLLVAISGIVLMRRKQSVG